MSRTESAALLEELGLKLSPEETEALHERIEGWPAALVLAGLFLAQQHNSVPRPRLSPTSRATISSYPTISGRVSLGDLARPAQVPDALIDTRGSRRADLRRGHAAIRVGTGPARACQVEPASGSSSITATGSHRYHPLFKQALAAELRRREPKLEPDLHRRASKWYADRERFEQAVDHAIAAGDAKRAGELIWARAAPALARGDRETVRHWLDRFSEREAHPAARACPGDVPPISRAR